MRCPICNNEATKVLDSRVATDGVTVRRRRECLKCNFRFSTIEEIEILDIKVVKRDGKKELYNKDKLRNGIKKSLEKRNKDDQEISQLIRAIEVDVQKKKSNEISSELIGDIVMKHLKKFDKVAYIRYASVYRSFEDLETFEEELKNLIHKKRS
ncbi:MAG: transcriptional regulator NrdR [Patescibacteria group bacterium]|nr:transcriptional regulator NrdR [Patescibacteria group bacterium]MDD4304101.1 transcriptional regulator NrdR [Patescibacteria group bacterium]MDD4694978.1 transcriptional regulator NrdR [Patescibacteria group bacterium]